MKDLDFDELDRAVNSLITSTPTSISNSETPKETTLDLGSGLFDQTSVTAPVSSQPVTPVIISTPVSPAVERPSTGRFMDVVHPSSNMRSNLAMPERNMNQQAPELKPIAAPYSAPVPVVVPVSSMPTPMSSNWANSPQITNEDDEDDDIDQIGNDIATAMEQNASAPLDSPFLSGTKVEKRPLGAFSNDQQTVEQQNKTQDIASSSNPSLPAELQDDLLLIESNSTDQSDEEANVKSVVGSISESLTVPVVPIVPISPVIIEAKPAVATSITQQYKEQPSSGDQKTGAIYDTNSYHKALTPTKKKSGWLWVLWIVLLLIIGAGSGAAVYFLVLPNL